MLELSLRKISRLVGYPKMARALLPVLPKPLGKALRRFHFRSSIRQSLRGPTPPVLVYSTPKTASTAVTEALQAVGGQPVFHVHVISAAGIRLLRDRMRARGMAPLRQDAINLAVLGHALDEIVIKPRCPTRIVSLVRDPIARNVSHYFELLNLLWQTERAHERVPVERLLAEFHEKFSHERGVNWFDNEFKPVLGIDVYEHPFPHDLGYLRIDSGPYEVLIMRHDLDDRVKERCLSELVGVRAVSLTPRNVGAQKPYAAVYREFLRRIELPEDYVNRLLDSKYARHFYAPEELARFRAKWLKKGSAAEALAAVGAPVLLAGGTG